MGSICVQSMRMSTQMQPTGASVSRSRRTQIRAGIRDSYAAGLGMFPIGVTLGLLVVQAGLPWWFAPAISVAAYAGSLELLLIGLVAAAVPLATIALTTFLVNFRHVFYALSFPLHVLRSRAARAYSMYSLIDEAYAVTAAAKSGTFTGPRLIAMQAAFQVYWVSGGLAGVAIAAVLPGPIEGLEFALCAVFVVLTLDAVRSRAEIPSVLLAGAGFAIATVIAPNAVLFVALIVFVCLLVGRHLLAVHRNPEVPDA